MFRKLYKKKQMLLDSYLKQSPNQVIIAGHHAEGGRTVHPKGEPLRILETPNDLALKIPTTNKFYLNITPELSAKRYAERETPKGKVVDKTATKLLINQAARDLAAFQRYGYKPMTYETIMKWFEENVPTTR